MPVKLTAYDVEKKQQKMHKILRELLTFIISYGCCFVFLLLLFKCSKTRTKLVCKSKLSEKR